ncbi:MAG: glycosyltransferase family 4 protein [Variovorax sp.]
MALGGHVDGAAGTSYAGAAAGLSRFFQKKPSMPPVSAASEPLKIALISYAYAPGVGGIETVSQLLFDGLQARGHQVRVVTHTPGDAERSQPESERIIRRPTAAGLLSTLRWADVVVQSNVSVGLAWPLTLGVVRKPWMVVNHTPIARSDGRRTWRDRLKLASLRGAQVYAVSRYLDSVTARNGQLMHNPYDAESFHLPSDANAGKRWRELLFVGRIVRAKGLDVLIEALHLLAEDGLRPQLSVAGDGPERQAIQARSAALGLEGQITWLGVLRGASLGQTMREHKIVVVPSRPEPPEALPLVPVESIASGCAVIASRQGGLPESVGPCGMLVAPEDPRALAQAVREMLTDDGLRNRFMDSRKAHLEMFDPHTVLQRYEAAIRQAMGKSIHGGGLKP